MNNEIRIDMLNQSYWEHFKAGKDLAFLYPPDHIKRVEYQNAANLILDKIEAIKNLKK